MNEEPVLDLWETIEYEVQSAALDGDAALGVLLECAVSEASRLRVCKDDFLAKAARAWDDSEALL